MIPQTLQFTDLTIPVDQVLFKFNKRKIQSPYPGDWTRVAIKNLTVESDTEFRLDMWLNDNIEGRWGHYHQSHTDSIVVMFEKSMDAVLFKLMDGELILKEKLLG